jgi:septal ring factor EnvC (AmiA/AmiB activator)
MMLPPIRWAVLRRFCRILLMLVFLASAAMAVGTRAAFAQDDQQAAWQAELTAILEEIAVTEERRNELREELADLDRDREALNQALIDTNRRVQELERDFDAIERRMRELVDEEAVLRDALAGRRDVLAEVLAVLQRMGRTPPPAIIVAPEDALTAVRSAILLGAVVPEIRIEAEALAADIEALLALREQQNAERTRIIEAANQLVEEQERLGLLVVERRQALDQTAETLAAEQARLAELGAEARNLEELIAAFDIEADPVIGEPAAIADDMPPSGAAERIDPAVAFGEAQGTLPRPANGELLIGFGMPDGLGGIAEGQSIATRPGATVAAPADGRIAFAGTYRSYGNILIVDVGGGHLVVLAGMARLDVQPGQFVLAGEPVGAMQSTQIAAASGVELGTVRPVLYVEFRRDGDAINPGPWWAEPY